MNRRDWLRDTLTAAMLPLVAGIVIPVALYLSNQREFSYDTGLLLPYAVITGGLVVLIAVVFACLPERARRRAAAILFCLGVYVALSDILAPVQLGQLKRTILMEPLAEPWTRDALDGLLLAAALAAGVLLPVARLRAAPVVVLALAAAELVALARGTGEARAQRHMERERVPPPDAVSTNGNVYFITFDGFSPFDFPERLRAQADATNFPGFVWFTQHRANYLETYVSLPSYLTGSYYEGGSLQAWTTQARVGGIPAEMRKAGYAVWQYTPTRSWMHQAASHVVYQDEQRAGDLADACHFGDLVVLRLAPHFLHQEAYPVGSRGLVSRLLADSVATSAPDAGPVRAVALMRRMIAEEAARPPTGQFVYTHVLVPHAPYVLNSHGEYAPGGGYAPQAEAAVLLMREFAAELQRLGRYDDALIVIHSDHGDGDIGPDSLAGHSLSPETAAQLARMEARFGFVALNALNLSHALLLVKAPGAREPFRTDTRRLTQNVDIPATIYATRGIPATTPAGVSALGPTPPDAIHIFQGFSHPNEFGMNVRYGVRVFEGQAEHLVYRASEGLAVEGYIPVVW